MWRNDWSPNEPKFVSHKWVFIAKSLCPLSSPKRKNFSRFTVIIQQLLSDDRETNIQFYILHCIFMKRRWIFGALLFYKGINAKIHSISHLFWGKSNGENRWKIVCAARNAAITYEIYAKQNQIAECVSLASLLFFLHWKS